MIKVLIESESCTFINPSTKGNHVLDRTVPFLFNLREGRQKSVFQCLFSRITYFVLGS